MDGYAITPHKVNHTVPAVGYLVECKSKRRFFYTGDTGPSDEMWTEIGNQRLHCLITEVSFPGRMEEFAIRTGHLTARLLGRELLKMRNTPERIYITSSKPKYFGIIRAEVEKLKMNNLRLLRDGETIKV
jgi:ribonuclease BN (tRNA processing enzyme)